MSFDFSRYLSSVPGALSTSCRASSLSSYYIIEENKSVVILIVWGALDELRKSDF